MVSERYLALKKLIINDNIEDAQDLMDYYNDNIAKKKAEKGRQKSSFEGRDDLENQYDQKVKVESGKPFEKS